MTIGITGGSGFLGQVVIKKLKDGKIDFSLLESDITNSDLKNFVQRNDTIIHLAGINRGEENEIYKVNVKGTARLLKACGNFSKDAKIVFASSFQVYLKESFYGKTKKLAEEEIEELVNKSNLKGTILRISNIYGPKGKPFYNSAIATFIYQMKNGEKVLINGDGTQKRDFIFVDDVVEAFIKALRFKQTKPLEIFDICSGEETSLNDILKILKRVSGGKIEVFYKESKKEKDWPTKGITFLKARKLLDWKPTTNIDKGLLKAFNA